MRDLGFTPQPRRALAVEMREVARASFDHGLRNPPVRWLMLSAPFGGGVSIYAFYAMQPYLLELHGSSGSYALAGLAAAVVAGAQIAGGLLVPHAGKLFRRRTSALLVMTLTSVASLALIGLVASFWGALALLAAWAVVFAAAIPLRQAFLNEAIPSAQRATVISSDNLLSSSGGVLLQPMLGRVADVWSYAASYLVAAGCELLALPFLLLTRRQRSPADAMAVTKP
jgi:MFS family permease